MYKKETLHKYTMEMMGLIEQYKNTKEALKLVFSNGNRKIGRVLNISTAAIITCKCNVCHGICYDIKACIQYQNVRNARAKNTALLLKDRDEFFRQIDEKMSRRRRNKYFRFHVGGEILDADYFRRMVEIARNHPDFTIWTYTKFYKAVNDYVEKYGRESIPENMTVMFSEWRGFPMVNPYGFPEFRVVFKDDEVKPSPDSVWYCPGNCDICKAAHRGCLAGETTYCNEH